MDLNHRLPLCKRGTLNQTELLGQNLVRLTGFEPAASSSAEKRSYSAELQAQIKFGVFGGTGTRTILVRIAAFSDPLNYRAQKRW
jgi:hypothetical protein